MNASKTMRSKKNYVMGALLLMLVMVSHASAGPLYEIGDYVWHDINQDGIQDSNEPGLEDIRVNLFDSRGVLLLDQTTTDQNGQYSFGGLSADTYIIEFVLFSGFSFMASFRDNFCRNNILYAFFSSLTVLSENPLLLSPMAFIPKSFAFSAPEDITYGGMSCMRRLKPPTIE